MELKFDIRFLCVHACLKQANTLQNILDQLLLAAAKGNQGLRIPLALPMLENTSCTTLLRNTYKAYQRQAGNRLLMINIACVK